LLVDGVVRQVIRAPKPEPRIIRYELTDFEWAAIRPFLPNKPRGMPRVNDRRVLNRAWFRFTFKWRDRGTGEPQTQAGMQSYRIVDGKLTETWIILQPPGSAWSDAIAQERWTSPPPQSN
jgi:transposase